MPPVISVENLSKTYRLGAIGSRTLRDDVARWWAQLRGQPDPTLRIGQAAQTALAGETLWALREVSFEVQQGEVLGIIGRNGAGKSTLLKILSRVTAPTAGQIKVRGRIASLLEVGTGFNPELTGRENIYLNGAILGMKRREIARKFDEIVAFSGVAEFIDTPVKRYSSGMYVRLAFAVAAHLEPEILIVDEVLAVGDAAFQKKCLGKMSEVAQGGRTVLFVSHNMATIGRLCPHTLLLQQGKLAEIGGTPHVIANYLATTEVITNQPVWPDITTAPGDEYLRITAINILDLQHRPLSNLYQDQAFIISFTYEVLKPMMSANIGFQLKSADGAVILTTCDADNPAWVGQARKPGHYIADCLMPAHFLNENTYYLTLEAGIPFQKLCVKAEDVLKLTVHGPITGTGPVARFGSPRLGLIAPEIVWEMRVAPANPQLARP